MQDLYMYMYLNEDINHGPSYIRDVYKQPQDIPLIRTLLVVPRVSIVERVPLHA